MDWIVSIARDPNPTYPEFSAKFRCRKLKKFSPGKASKTMSSIQGTRQYNFQNKLVY